MAKTKKDTIHRMGGNPKPYDDQDVEQSAIEDTSTHLP